MAADKWQSPFFSPAADVDLCAAHIQNDGITRVQFSGQPQDIAHRCGKDDEIRRFRQCAAGTFNCSNGPRTIENVGIVDSVDADTGNGLFQCEREGASDESGSMNRYGTWKAAIQRHSTFPISTFRP